MQNYVQNSTSPYINNIKPQVQTNPQAQPNYAGVHISIINPMVNPTTGTVTYPTQTASAYDGGTQGGCYPSSYYTTQPGITYSPQAQTPKQTPAGFYDNTGKYYPYVKDSNGQTGYMDDSGTFIPLNTVPAIKDNQTEAGTENSGQTTVSGENSGAGTVVTGQAEPNGFTDKEGKFRPYLKNANGQIGYYDDKGVFHPVDPNNNPEAGVQNTPNGFTDKEGKFRPYLKDANGQIGYYDDNGVFHPVDPHNNPEAMQGKISQEQNTTSDSSNKETKTTTSSESSDSEKTSKKKIVKLDNDYIKTVENYLNSQDTQVRKMGAQEVVNRLTEDSSRNDDPALTALVNKMLQDPSSGIRATALSLIESRSILGDDLTVKILKNMQKGDSGYGMDSTQATSALLKMAGKVEEKEVPITESKKK